MCPFGADEAKARSPKRSDGSLCCTTGESKLLAAQHEAGAARPQAALTGPPAAALTAYLAGYLPWGGEATVLFVKGVLAFFYTLFATLGCHRC